MAAVKFLMYSFKGGAGRTVTAANVSYILAREMQCRVLLMDIDVESAGCSVLFGLDKVVREGSCWSLQDIIRGRTDHAAAGQGESSAGGSIQLNRKDFEETLWPKMHGMIWRDDKGFLEMLPSQIIMHSTDEIKVSTEKGQRQFEHLIRKIEGMTKAPEIIVFDSSSGQQDTAMLGLMSCNILVIFVRWSRQFVLGTTQFLNEYICQERFCPRLRQVFIVPTAVPLTEPSGKLGKALQHRRKSLEDTVYLVNQRAQHDFGAKNDWVKLLAPVHECNALKWDDRVFLMDEPEITKDASVVSVLEDYRSLAKSMVEATRRSTE